MKKDSNPIPFHVKNFLDWLDIERGLSSKTQENYARFLKPFLTWLDATGLAGLKPHELTADHIWKYRVFLSRRWRPRTKAALSKATQNYYLIAVRALLNYFAHRDITALPAEKVQLAKNREERAVRFLTLEQLEKLFAGPNTATLSGLRDRAILEVLFSTGLRVAELVLLDRNQVRIKPSARELEIAVLGKGGRLRTVYLSERAIRSLQVYLEQRSDTIKSLFVNYRGRKDAPRRLATRSIEKMIKKYAVAAGLPLTTTPHVMRHSFATDLLAQGVDLRVIQEFWGHKSIAATQIYTHVTSKRLREIHHKFRSGSRDSLGL